MVKCKTCLVVLIPVLAILVYQALQNVTVEYELKTTVRAPMEKVFNYLKDPEHLRDLIPNIVEIKIMEHQSDILDEEDGYMKDVYSVSVVQDLPYKSGFTFNFTRKVSSAQNTIESQGDMMMGSIHYKIVDSLKPQKSGAVEMTEQCEMQMPKGLSWLISNDVKTNHRNLNNKIKERVEEGEKVGAGTQTES